jgi:hypothetical protein
LTVAVILAFGIGLAVAETAAPRPPSANTAAPRPLSANDVSILFPAPKNARDLANLIALSDLTGPAAAPQRGRLWSEADFARFLAIAEDPAVQVAGADLPIELPAEVKRIEAWFIAGIRIDPGAPGLSKEIIAQYGQQPQIRLIVQPVTRTSGGNVEVHDIAAHLIFSFSTQPPEVPAADGCLPRPKPDIAAFQAVVRDAVALRDQLAARKFGNTKIETAGLPLNVHPGLTGASAKPFRDALKSMLEKNLASPRLTSMAVMALNAPEPWIFVAMQKVPAGGQLVFVPVSGPMLDGKQVAQMLSFRGDQHVIPAPTTNNQNPITCRHAAFQNPPLPKTDRKGVATADFFDGKVVESRTKAIVDIIADPKQSHFFNTDCISCHTDTRQGMDRIKNFTVAGVAKQVLPKENWNVRNFGWFPSFFRQGAVEPTITRRTATETAEVVEFINKELLGK